MKKQSRNVPLCPEVKFAGFDDTNVKFVTHLGDEFLVPITHFKGRPIKKMESSRSLAKFMRAAIKG